MKDTTSRDLNPDPQASSAALAGLERQIAFDLDAIEVPPRSWVPPMPGPDGATVSDVVIVGAGLSGLAIAFGLRRKGVERVRIIDSAPAGLEGPWLTTARMHTLRSPKFLSGPDLGVPSLTYRAWHTARYGAHHYAALGKIDRHDWMAYLAWFRESLALPVENETLLVGIDRTDGHSGVLTLTLETGNQRETAYCRKLVLATGIEGGGGPAIPSKIKAALPKKTYTHSAEPLDTDTLAGKRVAVLGAAASAFDWAVAALKAGAARVDLVARNVAMPVTEILDWSNFPGFLDHFGDLPPAERLAFTRRMLAFRNPPTQEMYDAALGHERFTMHRGARIIDVAYDGGVARLALADGTTLAADHVLLGTGYTVDLSCRPELASVAPHSATWGDAHPDFFSDEDDPLRCHPYLTTGFALTGVGALEAGLLDNIHLFNTAAVLSLGPICNGVTGLKAGVPRLVSALTADLFKANTAQFYASLDAFETRHLDPRAAAP